MVPRGSLSSLASLLAQTSKDLIRKPRGPTAKTPAEVHTDLVPRGAWVILDQAPLGTAKRS